MRFSQRRLNILAVLSVTGIVIAFIGVILALCSKSGIVMNCAIVSGLGGGLARAVALIDRTRLSAKTIKEK